jgi:multicomponent Na+:H+ antiporter subunit B
VLLSFMTVVAIGAARLQNLFAATMLFGSYSLLSAALLVSLDAVDVAFTEAAVGAGVATMLMLATLARTTSRQQSAPGRRLGALAAALVVGLLLMIGLADMPDFGEPSAPVHTHLVDRYLLQSGDEIGIPNVVTSVLASYRGYDTLGEVTVIFTAGIGVLSLLATGRRRGRR